MTRGQLIIMQALTEYGPMNAYRTLYNSKDDYLMGLLSMGVIRIKSWQAQRGHGGAPVPTYAAGGGVNAPRPKRKRRKVAKHKSIIAVMLGV